MRHRLGLRKLNRTSSHRLAMLRNMTNSLLLHEVINLLVQVPDLQFGLEVDLVVVFRAQTVTQN